MIKLSNANGKLIKVLNATQANGVSAVMGYHPIFGFISEEVFPSRVRARKLAGLKTSDSWSFRFSLVAKDGLLNCLSVENCAIEKNEANTWKLKTQIGDFLVSAISAEAAANGFEERIAKDQVIANNRKLEKIMAGIAAAIALILYFMPNVQVVVEPTLIADPVEVKIVERQKSVRVPVVDDVPKILANKTNVNKVAIAQNLGFLSVLGQKNLTKTLGGMPLNEGSAGAGAGGNQGSGGELLVGLGQGVKRTTVGNSGVVGLGGVGTKGAGGGAGGYGTTTVGSGNGKGISSVPLSQDMVLEGGLDASVIQATIAKYLNEVRACYEVGLRKTPGLMGQVSMYFEIDGAGAVSSSRVTKSSLGNSEVEQCIAQKILGWQFPKPRGGVKVKVNYPFFLRPVQS